MHTKRTLKKFLQRLLLSLVLVVSLGAGLFGYFLYTPDAIEPKLSGTLQTATIDVGGVTYTYRLYLPNNLPERAPLVLVLHGSGQNGAQIRMETGFGFDRLADAKQFAVLYPSSKSFDWNDCSNTGDFQVDGRELDHQSYLNTLVDRLVATHQFDRNRVFVTGVSSGGFMSLRLALESASRFRAVAAVSANVPAAGNFKCQLPRGEVSANSSNEAASVAGGENLDTKERVANVSSSNGAADTNNTANLANAVRPAESAGLDSAARTKHATSSVLFINGTADPLVPYQGGHAALWGMFFDSGEVLSAQASAEFFARLNQLGQQAPNTAEQATEQAATTTFERRVWQGDSKVQVELITIPSGGHGMPQPDWQRPRLLGPSPMSPNGPELIWQFFNRSPQQSTPQQP